MHNEPVDYPQDDSSKPLVEWYSRRGPVGSLTPQTAVIAGAALGLFVAGALTLGLLRRAFGGGSLRELEVDRLIVKSLHVKDQH